MDMRSRESGDRPLSAPKILRAALLGAFLLAPSPLASASGDGAGTEAARQLYLRLTQRHNRPPLVQSLSRSDGTRPISEHRHIRPPKWHADDDDDDNDDDDDDGGAWRPDRDENGGKTTTTRSVKQQNANKPMISAVFTTTLVSTNRSRSLPATASPVADEYRNTIVGDYDRPASDEGGVELLDGFPSSSVFLVVLIGTFFALATTIGNLMVMISIRVDKQLQTISNYFLFSLAVADITIGIISIPLMTYYTALQHWGIGYAACQFWLSVDYLMSNASVLNLLLISFDRYFSVTRPLTYRPRRTTKKALTMISITYIVSVFIWPPWIIGWPYIEGKITVEEGTCVVQFLALSSQNWASQLATIGTSVAAFYLPVSVMILLYYRVFRETKRRQRELKKLQAGQIRGMGGRIPPASNGSLAVSSAGGGGGDGGAGHSHSFSAAGGGETPLAATGAEKSTFSDLRKQFLPIFAGGLPAPIPLEKKSKFRSLLRYCSGRSVTTELSSEEESSDVVIPVEDTSLGSSVLSSSLRKSRKLHSAEDKATVSTTISNNAFIGGGAPSIAVGPPADCSPLKAPPKFRGRGSQPIPIICIPPPTSDPIKNNFDGSATTANNSISPTTDAPSSTLLHSYKVLIEYCEIEGKRPSVRLSSATPPTVTAANGIGGERNTLLVQRTQSADAWRKPTSCSIDAAMNGTVPASSDVGRGASFRSAGAWSSDAAVTSPPPTDFDQPNGKQRAAITTSVSMKEEFLLKSEKERRKNERRQESKAAKTLSAILFAFIVTWTPYNVIVCWEAFFPNSIPDTLFTISYCLCYVNSTINPVCYALCNARFRMTFLRIMRCASWRKFNKASLYRHAYLKRN